MHRTLNYLFCFLLVVVFISAANVIQQWNILLGIVLSALFALAAFWAERLSLDGMYAAIVVGTFVFGLGGWEVALLLILFFISSAIWSGTTADISDQSGQNVRRDGYQVWANGFWIVMCLVLMVFYNAQLFLIGAIGALATATADTWSTELGSRSKKSTYLITNFINVSPGTDGGVSFRGTFAALSGSALIAVVTIYMFSLSLQQFLIIFTAGFLGSLIDSYFGAIFQQNNRSVTLPVSNTTIGFDNNLVNGISTGAGALLAITLKLVFG